LKTTEATLQTARTPSKTGTLYNHIPDLREFRTAGRARHQLRAASAEAS
jgi:hypothetical protein